MEETDAVLAGILDQLQATVIEQGPEAAALAGHVYQLAAAGRLSSPIVLALLLIPLLFWLRRSIRAAVKAGIWENDGWIFSSVVAGVTSTIVGVLSLIGIAHGVLSPLMWAKALDPQIALAAAILDKL